MFIMQLVKGYRAILIDIETAFLNSDLDEKIYMDIPQGLEDSNNTTECLLLLKGIYGLVQSAWQWWRKLIAILKDMRFKGSVIDPCLYFN